jgi:hypothetical protein
MLMSIVSKVLFAIGIFWFAQIPALPAFAVEQRAASSPAGQADEIVERQDVRPLPGGLNDNLMFNSNSPEVVQSEGILLSTFPGAKLKVPVAHLNQTLSGEFSLFAHHISKAVSATDLRTLYLGLIVSNASTEPVKLKVENGATYDSQPDAPFIPLPPLVENPDGNVFAGPGDRVTDDVLRGRRQDCLPADLELSPGETKVLVCQPIPVANLTPPLNGRSMLLNVKSNGPVHVATLAMYAPKDALGNEREPTKEEWQDLLAGSGLAGPREKEATPPGAVGSFHYGRVAGVQRGTAWKAVLSDSSAPGSVLSLPDADVPVSFVLSTVDKKTLGTKQIQSAPLMVRYPDSAYQAHGNYGVEYDLTLPLFNAEHNARLVALEVQTPARQQADSVVFEKSPADRVFFRGTVCIQYKDEAGHERRHYVHIAEKLGERAAPLQTFSIPARSRKDLRVRFFYPPDATPPQILTIRTLRQANRP